ncbi:MAG TPA: electron transporter RnfE [Candidatus Moranbacteria bacterium]|nr:electron transporter RnfE [Candidatus Moranbacteria bacterium]
MMGNFYNNGWGGGWFGFGWIFMLVFWGLVIWGILALVKDDKYRRRDRDERNPRDILKERYAKGEINKEEFERMKKDLM